MALGAVLGAALTSAGVRARSIFLGGLDVVREPGGSAGVPIESVRVTEAGPGRTSSMSFVVDDPALSVSVARGMEVRFYNHTTGFTDFLGYVQEYTVSPAFGQQGRMIEIQAIGVEAVLDWAKTIGGMTFAVGSVTNSATAIQSVVANSIGLGPIRAGADPSGTSSQAAPVLQLAVTPNAASFTIPAGTTVREAIQTILANVIPPGNPIAATVDFTFGLRTWVDDSPPGTTVPGYAIETIVNTPAGAIVSEDLQYTVATLDAPVGVVVSGSSGIGANVSSGTNLMGPVASITDTTLTTNAAALQRGYAYMATFSQTVRGRYARTDRQPNIDLHPGSLVIITDARVGLSATNFRVFQIDKTYNPSGRENWLLSFGGAPPSGAALIRRLTRTTLS